MAEKGLNCGINKTLIMATKITVPDIGDFENVEIIEILTKPGAIIKKNDPVVTLESDKSSVEVPSPFSGKISSVEVKIGDKVSKGSVLAVIENEEVKVSPKPKKEEKENHGPAIDFCNDTCRLWIVWVVCFLFFLVSTLTFTFVGSPQSFWDIALTKTKDMSQEEIFSNSKSDSVIIKAMYEKQFEKLPHVIDIIFWRNDWRDDGDLFELKTNSKIGTLYLGDSILGT